MRSSFGSAGRSLLHLHEKIASTETVGLFFRLSFRRFLVFVFRKGANNLTSSTPPDAPSPVVSPPPSRFTRAVVRLAKQKQDDGRRHSKPCVVLKLFFVKKTTTAHVLPKKKHHVVVRRSQEARGHAQGGGEAGCQVEKGPGCQGGCGGGRVRLLRATTLGGRGKKNASLGTPHHSRIFSPLPCVC
jgi:hypothetical protein